VNDVGNNLWHRAGNQELHSIIIWNDTEVLDTIPKVENNHQQPRVIIIFIDGLIADWLEVDAGLVTLALLGI
jgi:hypothetical protein